MISSQLQRVSFRGKQLAVPVLEIGPKIKIITMGKFLKIAEIHDEFWLHPKDLPKPTNIVEKLKRTPKMADLFKFSQKLPHVSPKYGFDFEIDNIAVIKINSYDFWFKNQINRKARQAITRSQRKGVCTKIAPFSDELVKGICDIYNETPFRQGKTFWHYKKPFLIVREENGTYLENSVFIGAYHKNELIGFVKIIFNGEVASFMQIISKLSHKDKNPNNALLAKAVEICESKNAKYLTYGKYVYGNKFESSLIQFKRHNGFEKVDIPLFYVPLSFKGYIAMKMGMHKGWDHLIPQRAKSFFVNFRERYYKWKIDNFEK